MKVMLTAILVLVSQLSAFAEEHIEKYNIFGTTYELGINDSEVQLEDFEVREVPTVVKVKTLDFCDGMDMCRSFEVLESKEVLHLSFSYQVETQINDESPSARRFEINFPLSSIPADKVEQLKLMRRGFNTPKKIRARVELAHEFFREETTQGFGKKIEIDHERSNLCFPEDPYCVENIVYVSRKIPVKKFSVILK